MGYKKWEDWQGTALDVWEETPASDIGAGLIRHVWQGEKYGVLQKGTTLKADMMNNLQMGLDFLVDSNHTVINSEDHYIITIDGLKTATSNPDGYELVENLHFSIKITEENANGISKLIINGDSYDLQKKENDVVVELNNVDLKAGKIYSVYYDGARFLIKNSVLPSTETEAGIMSGLDIRSTEAAYVLGAEYGGTFGSALTRIEKGKTYYYWDSTKQIYIPYLALKNSTKVAGFITPDIDNFSNLSSQNMTYQLKNYSDFLMYLDRQTLILYLMKRNILEPTLEYVTSQIISFINNSDYTILPGTPLANFNIGKKGDTSKVYNGYGIFQSTSGGIKFFYGESNTLVTNNASFYFHSGEIKIKMEAK